MTARAVGRLAELAELCLPLARIGGVVLAMKGPGYKEEIGEAKKAISLLGAKVERVVEMTIPETDIERNIIVLKKVKPTSPKFPRSPVEIDRSPL